MRNLPPAVKNLLIINIIVFAGTYLVGDKVYEWFALFPIGSKFFHWWQFVTHMFMLRPHFLQHVVTGRVRPGTRADVGK